MKYLARTVDGKNFTGESDCQELREHLENTAAYARSKGDAFGAGETCEVIALFHDAGKYSKSFQDKIRGKTKAKVKHAIAGTYALKERYGEPGKLLGIVVASHHTGLSDYGIKTDRDNVTYLGKLFEYEESETDKHLTLAAFNGEITSPVKIVPMKVNYKQSDKKAAAFQAATLIRMLFSVLVDSDFTDSEEFCSGRKRESIAADFSGLFEILLNEIPKSDGSIINNIRAKVLENCVKSAEMPKGLFTLTVPTGGGKTYSSMAFALKHAYIHGLRRVIYVIPYTSIIEQNAAVIKGIFGAKIVLEHHSSIAANSDWNEDGGDIAVRHATENWDVPIVFTTNVQFFESLFSNKTSKSRKIHNIANSVVIFDEAQMLPNDYLSPCMAIISELINNYGVSAVLCSATQPHVDKYIYNISPREIYHNPDELAQQLKRVEFTFSGQVSDDELVSVLGESKQILVVVNSRKHAYVLYASAKNAGIDEDDLFYLSTLNIPKHRSEKIKDIKNRLKEGLPVKVISTQLIEAGVDIDFPVVYRSIAGIDSIIQAGGRANREGRLINYDGTPKPGKVVVFEPCGEHGQVPRSLMLFANKGKEVISALGAEAFTLSGIKKYYELLHHSLENSGLMDKKGILDEFETLNSSIKMNFATVAERFKMIDEDTKEIVVNTDRESASLIEKLYKGEDMRDTVRGLQKYSISVYENDYVRLLGEKAVQTVNGVNVLIAAKYYTKNTGLDIFSGENKNAEALFH